MLNRLQQRLALGRGHGGDEIFAHALRARRQAKAGQAKGKGGKTYQHWSGFTLETQHFPDAPNQPSFASTRLNPGQTYSQHTIFKFTAD